MKKIRPAKLALSRETLTTLADDRIPAQGGLASGDTGILCTLHCVLTSVNC